MFIKLIFTLLVVGALVFLFYHFFKVPKLGSLALITGGVKTGKSTLAIHIAIRKWFWRRLFWGIGDKFRSLFRLKRKEKPLLYSNIPLANLPFHEGYTPLENDLLERKKRFAYKSVIYVCEASLVADSMMFKDMKLNDRLMLFNKLIGHETHGGMVIYDTQSILDNHYAVKKCLSNYIYIHHIRKWLLLPFITCYVLENRYSEDGSVSNTEFDVEDNLKRVIIGKWVWRKFDCYCYSYNTDDLPVVDDQVVLVNNRRHKCDLRAKEIFSFKKGGINYNNEREENRKDI